MSGVLKLRIPRCREYQDCQGCRRTLPTIAHGLLAWMLPYCVKCHTVVQSGVIRSFRDKETEKVFRREFSRKFQAVASVAKRKLDHIHAAATLSDLGAIAGNRLEVLAGDRKGQYSIRVNDQWRICFRWVNADALDVEIVDYH
jgi:proteic killer suppression protein